MNTSHSSIGDEMQNLGKLQQDAMESTEVSVSQDDMLAEVTIDPLPAPLVRSMPRIYDETLIPVDLSFGLVRGDKNNAMKISHCHKKAIRERQFVGKAKASVCFVVRKPGCIICHEQGHVLSELMSTFPGNKVAAWGVVKEINVDDDGLLRMYKNYFRFPFFLDAKKKLYKAMGDRKLNIFQHLWYGKETRERIERRGINATANSTLGEGFTLGGILIFDEEGKIRYAFNEQSGGEEFPFDQIRAGIQNLVGE